MIEDIKRLEGETDFEYGLRLAIGKVENTYDLDWQDIIDACNLNIHRDVLRKAFNKTGFGFSGYDMIQYMKNKYQENFTEDDLLKEIELKKIELKKEQQKFYDQRTAFNKVIRERARQEELNDIIVQTINSADLPELNFIHNEIKPSNNDLLVSLNDIHYGIDVNNAWNVYNSDVCKEMLNTYLNEIISVKQLHNSENCFVCCNGDMISGAIHKSIALENKENVVQQIMGVSELIANFLAELSPYFNNITFSSVAGNHSRLTEDKDTLKDERLDNLIQWYVKARVQNCKNIHINENKIDDTMYLVNIRGKNYLGVHGDYDNSNYKIQSLVEMVDDDVYAVLLGHLHNNQTRYIQGIKTLMAGSFVGMDSYCIQKRIKGQPQQMICVCTDKGVRCHYDVNF